MRQTLGLVELGSVELGLVRVSSQCQSVAIRVLQLFLECPSSFLNVSRCEGIPCAFVGVEILQGATFFISKFVCVFFYRMGRDAIIQLIAHAADPFEEKHVWWMCAFGW